MDLLLITSLLLGAGIVGMAVFATNEFSPTRGEEEHVFQAPASATVIYIGDLLFQDPTTRQPEPASALIDQGSEALNQDAFQQYFLGVAEQQSLSGYTDRIRIATRGVKTFDCVSDAYYVGDWLAVDEASSGTALERRKLVKTTVGDSKAIAVCTKDTGAAATKVEARFVSTILYGGLQTQVAGSSSGAI